MSRIKKLQYILRSGLESIQLTCYSCRGVGIICRELYYCSSIMCPICLGEGYRTARIFNSIVKGESNEV